MCDFLNDYVFIQEIVVKEKRKGKEGARIFYRTDRP